MMMPRFSMMATVLALVAAGAACGGSQPAGGGATTTGGNGVVKDTRTELERRLEAACDALGPKLTRCAVEDTQAEFDAGKISKQEFDTLTTAQMQDALTRDWGDKCNRPDRTSRQVRVLEVCFAQEPDCAPLLDCLENLSGPN